MSVANQTSTCARAFEPGGSDGTCRAGPQEARAEKRRRVPQRERPPAPQSARAHAIRSGSFPRGGLPVAPPLEGPPAARCFAASRFWTPSLLVDVQLLERSRICMPAADWLLATAASALID